MNWPISRYIGCVDGILFFSDMTKHERAETDEYTGKEETHAFHTCPDEYDHGKKVLWMNFINVVRTEGDK